MGAIEFVQWPSLVILLTFVLFYMRQRFKRPPLEQRSTLADRACQISQKMNVPYVTMGHTHDVDLQIFQDEAEYFNTGTWTKVFGQDEDRLLREESELVFLQLIRNQPDTSVKLMKWEDGANEPRLVMLFEKESK